MGYYSNYVYDMWYLSVELSREDVEWLNVYVKETCCFKNVKLKVTGFARIIILHKTNKNFLDYTRGRFINGE